MTSIAIANSTINVPFHGHNLFLINLNNEPYVPMKPVVEGMGMVWASQFVKLKQRFAKGISEIEIPSNGGKQVMTCLAFRKFAGWLQTISPNKVKPEIRDRVIQYQNECDDVLYEYWTTGEVKRKSRQCTAKQLIPLRQVAERLITTGIGQIYPDIWKLVHQKFEVDHIHQLQPDQVIQAVDYLNTLEGEFLGKRESLLTPRCQFSDEELCSLCWMWQAADYMLEKIEIVYPALKTLNSDFAPNFYSMAYEYKRTLEDGRKILERETNHIVPHPYSVSDESWRRVLHRIRHNGRVLN